MNDSQRDDLLIRMDQNLKNALDVLKDHESRIRTSEKFRWLLVGGAAVGGTGFGAALSQIVASTVKMS